MPNYLFNLPGKNSWKQYFFSLIIILLFLIIGSILYVTCNLLFGEESSYLDQNTMEFIGLNPITDYLFSHLINISWLIGIWISIKFIHKRTLTSLITYNNHVNWKEISWGFSLYFVIYTIFRFIESIFFIDQYRLNDINLYDFSILFIITLIFVPIQATVEELFFRGFLLQWFAKKISNIFILSLIMALIFGSLHFTNPEMDYSTVWVSLNYLFAGFMLTFISIKMGKSELSIGAHAANNIFFTLFIADKQSINGSIPSLFKIINFHPMSSFIGTVSVFVIFYIISHKKFMKSNLT